jgi:hypothetical protein
MNISEQELRERYQALSTDELVAIATGGELTELARRLLKEELGTRKVTSDHVEHARSAHAAIEADREEIKSAYRRRFKRYLFLLVLAAIYLIYKTLFS